MTIAHVTGSTSTVRLLEPAFRVQISGPGSGRFERQSSLRMIHMCDPRSGAEVARLGQYGVNLDLDARRPARWPDEIRARAAGLVVPVG